MHPMPEFFEPSGNLFGWRVALRQGSFGQGNRSHRDYRGEIRATETELRCWRGWSSSFLRGDIGFISANQNPLVAVLGHIREHKVQIGRPLYEGLGRFAPLVNGTLLGVLELGTSL